MDKFCVFASILMRDVSPKTKVQCIIRISISGAFFGGKKCTLHTVNTVYGKDGQ